MLTITRNLEFVAKVDQKPIQYYGGYMMFGESHQSYDPNIKSIQNTRIIVDHEPNAKAIKAMRVEDEVLIIF